MKRYHTTSSIPPFGRAGGAERDRRFPRFSATQKTQTYDAVHLAGANGFTAQEISAKSGVNIERVRFYLSDLRRGGFIDVKGDPSVVVATMSVEEAAFAAMLGLENALVLKARSLGCGDPVKEKDPKYMPAILEINKQFVRYNKVKTMALSEANETSSDSQKEMQANARKVALRQSLIDLVKMVY